MRQADSHSGWTDERGPVTADMPEREAGLALLERQPLQGQLVLCDKGFARAEFEQAVGELQALVVRPSRADEPDRPEPQIDWIRQRIESMCRRSRIHSASSGTWPSRPPGSRLASWLAWSRSALPFISTGNSAGRRVSSSGTAIDRPLI